ncbi:MAG: hypothetical protein ACM3TN_07865 [Alphaproteobacteria bacterium]
MTLMPMIRLATRLAIPAPLAVAGLLSFAAAATDAIRDAARQEGEVVYYASMNLGEANTLIYQFEKR